MQQSETPLLITPLRCKKLPKQQCLYCKEIFRTKSALDKHIICCKLIYNQPLIYDNDIPSIASVYKMLVATLKEINEMKQQLAELSSRVPKKKEKIVFIDWLNENRKCTQTFQQLKTNIIINPEFMINLFHDKSIYDILDKLLQNNLLSSNTISLETPILALEHEPNKFYIFQKDGWSLATKEIIAKFLQKIQLDIYYAFHNWKKSQYREDEPFNIQCDKIDKVILDINYEENSTAYMKGKNILWKIVKQLFQATTEYEFVYE